MKRSYRAQFISSRPDANGFFLWGYFEDNLQQKPTTLENLENRDCELIAHQNSNSFEHMQ